MSAETPLTFPVPVCSCGHTVAQHERCYGSHETRCVGEQAEGSFECSCAGCVDARASGGTGFCSCRAFVEAKPETAGAST